MWLPLLNTITAEWTFQIIYSLEDRLTEIICKFSKLFWLTANQKFYSKIFRENVVVCFFFLIFKSVLYVRCAKV